MTRSELKLAPLSLKTERLLTKDSPRSFFVKVQEEFENAFLLESAIGEKDSVKTDDPLRELRKLVTIPASSRLQSHSPFRFIGGAVGYISYDSVRYWERIPTKTRDDLFLPDMEFGISKYEYQFLLDVASGRVSATGVER